jgi:curved DNA-binding protein CbpA
MAAHTHYEILGLAQNAPLPVIKAAYKALVLIYHPDKTLGLGASERAEKATIFREVQEAYDVLVNPLLRIAYDAELKHHGNKVDLERSTFHRPQSRFSTSCRLTSVKLTPPQQKAAMRAKAEAQLNQIRKERAESEKAEANMDLNDLRETVKLWESMAIEKQADPVAKAHCHVKITEYEQKVRDKEIEQKQWLDNLSTSRHRGFTNAGSFASPQAPSRTKPLKTSRRVSPSIKEKQAGQNREEIKHRVEERAVKTADRVQARIAERAKQDASKQAKLDAKQAAVRIQKEEQKMRNEQAAKSRAEAHRRARQKAAASELSISTAAQAIEKSEKIPVVKTCARCGNEHASLAEWKLCAILALSDNEGRYDTYFQTE